MLFEGDLNVFFVFPWNCQTFSQFLSFISMHFDNDKNESTGKGEKKKKAAWFVSA